MVQTAERTYRWAGRRALWRHHAAHLIAWFLVVLVWAPYLTGENRGSETGVVEPFALLVVLFLLYALVVATLAAVRSPLPRFPPALLGMRNRPGVESVTPAVRHQKITSRCVMLVQITGLVLVLSAPFTPLPGGLFQAAVGLGVVAAIRFWPPQGHSWRTGLRGPDRDRWRRAGWQVELGERRPYAETTQAAGGLSAAGWVPVLPRTVDVRIVWTGIGVTAAAGFVLLVFGAGSGEPLPAVQEASFGFLLLYAAYRLQRLSRRIVMPGAAEAMREDERAPVLLLRAFAEDATMVRAAVSSRRPLLERLSPVRSVRFEEALARQLDEFGPVIAVSAPGTTLPLLGAALEATTGERWTELVGGWIRRASMIVVVAPPRELTPGLRWELDAISAVGAWPRTMLVLPPVHRGETRRRWASFEAVLTAALGRPVRLAADPAAALAVVVEADRLLTVVAGEKSEWSYAAAVRAGRRHLADVTAAATEGEVTVRDGPQAGDQRALPPPPEQPPAPIAPWVPPPPVPSRPPPLMASLLAGQRAGQRGGARQVAQESFEFQSAWAANIAAMLLIVGLISLMIWPLGIVALLGGWRRLRKLRESAYPLPGRGAATAAVVLGTMSTILTAYVVVLVVNLLTM
jgi:hypothetical protein